MFMADENLVKPLTCMR